MAQSETFKYLKQFVKEHTADYGYFGLRVRVDIDPDFSDGGIERYMITVFDELYSNDCTANEVEDEVISIVHMFQLFMNMPSECYQRIVRKKEAERITRELQAWPDNTYYYYEPMFEGDSDYDCPTVNCYIDELQLTDSSVYAFLVHKIELDENGNIKLTGRRAHPDFEGEDELWTYLNSVYEFDMQLLDIPDPSMSEDLENIGVQDIENEVEETSEDEGDELNEELAENINNNLNNEDSGED